MANLSDQKTLQNKSLVMGPTVIHTDALSDLRPEEYEGSFAYSSDKKMYFSNGSVWRTTEDPPIKTPNASAPTSDTTTQRQLTLSTFLNSTLSGPQFKQTGIIFEISLVPSMKNLIMQKTIETVVRDNSGTIIEWPKINRYDLLETDTIPNLKPGDVFYWRGKYLATENQESGFSKPYAQTFPEYIDTPKATLGMNQVTNSIGVSAYHTPFGTRFPVDQIQWLIATKDDFSNAIYIPPISVLAANSNPLDTINIIPTADITYYWKARYISTALSGSKRSAYSIPFSSIQVRDVVTPEPVAVLGATGKVALLKISAYRSITGKARASTEWYISENSDDLVNTPPRAITRTSGDGYSENTLDIVTLDETVVKPDGKTVYYWRARYKNQSGTYSEYSAPSSFIRYPEIINPTAITVRGTDTETISVTSFNSEYSTVYPYTQTEWEIYDAATDLLLASAKNSSNTLEVFHTYSDTVILPSTYYRWRVRQKK